MKCVVRFDCAGIIANIPKNRRDWERRLMDDFIKAIHGKQYLCKTREELIYRLEFISGHGGHGISWDAEENHVNLDSTEYGERVLPIQMYGYAQGYVNFNKRIEPLEHGTASVFIMFSDFYDIRQRCPFKGGYIEISRVSDEQEGNFAYRFKK